jgi:hypothetical protein
MIAFVCGWISRLPMLDDTLCWPCISLCAPFPQRRTRTSSDPAEPPVLHPRAASARHSAQTRGPCNGCHNRCVFISTQSIFYLTKRTSPCFFRAVDGGFRLFPDVPMYFSGWQGEAKMSETPSRMVFQLAIQSTFSYKTTPFGLVSTKKGVTL